MREARGYIRLPRYAFETDKLFEKRPWHPWMFWQYLIYLAAWKPKQVRVGNHTILLQRGQLFHGEAWLAKKAGWSRHRVRNELRFLSDDGRLTFEAGHSGTLVTLLHYDRWQGPPSEKGPPVGIMNRRTSKKGTDVGTDAKSTPDDEIAHDSDAAPTALGTSAGHLRDRPFKKKVKKEKKSEPRQQQPPGDPETKRPEPTAAAVGGADAPEDEMEELPEVVTAEPELGTAAARCVEAFHAALPRTAAARLRPPSPANFARLKAAIVTDDGNWKRVRDGIVSITKAAIARGTVPDHIGYALYVWQAQAPERLIAQLLEATAAEDTDPRARKLVNDICAKMCVANAEKAKEVPLPARESPAERAAREAWQAERKREKEEEDRMNREDELAIKGAH